jgi:hypothetical protein
VNRSSYLALLLLLLVLDSCCQPIVLLHYRSLAVVSLAYPDMYRTDTTRIVAFTLRLEPTPRSVSVSFTTAEAGLGTVVPLARARTYKSLVVRLSLSRDEI